MGRWSQGAGVGARGVGQGRGKVHIGVECPGHRCGRGLDSAGTSVHVQDAPGRALKELTGPSPPSDEGHLGGGSLPSGLYVPKAPAQKPLSPHPSVSSSVRWDRAGDRLAELLSGRLHVAGAESSVFGVCLGPQR